MQSRAEIYFIAAVMFLIVVGSVVAVVAFFRTYKKEKAERELEKQRKIAEKQIPNPESEIRN